MSMDGAQVRALRDAERPWLAKHLANAWGSTSIVSRGRIQNASELLALVCELKGELVGAATFNIEDGACELVTLDALHKRAGIGSALLNEAIALARQAECERIWLVTSNDNLAAMRFYQRRGMRLVAVHPGAIDAGRAMKPSIPSIGMNDIPIHDELEFELRLR